MSTRLMQLLAISLLLTLLGGTARAFVPVEQRSGLSIAKPGTERPPIWRTEALEAGAHAEAALFEARAGDGWSYQWNPLTGTPHAVYGPGVPISSGRLTNEAGAEAAARAFVGEYRALLGVDPLELRVRSIRERLGEVGRDLRSGPRRGPGRGVEPPAPDDRGRPALLLRFGLASRHRDSDGAGPRPPASIGEGGSRRSDSLPGRDSEDVPELKILAVPEGEGIGYRLVWRTRQRVAEPFAIWVSYVDAQNGAILWRFDDVQYANVVGSTKANVEDYGYCYGEQDRPMPNMKVTVTGGSSAYSDGAGAYSITNGGTTPVTVTAQLDGRWINVNDVPRWRRDLHRKRHAGSTVRDPLERLQCERRGTGRLPARQSHP